MALQDFHLFSQSVYHGGSFRCNLVKNEVQPIATENLKTFFEKKLSSEKKRPFKVLY